MTPKLPASKRPELERFEQSARRPGEPSREGSMRRVLGASLTGLGAFFLVLALLLRFVLPSQVIKWPLNEYQVTSLTGHNVSYFNQGLAKVLAGAPPPGPPPAEGGVSARPPPPGGAGESPPRPALPNKPP